jgi:APA family basic amino acid/polyamine antiporter
MNRTRLVRGLGVVTLTGLVAGNIVGSGIYIEPGKLADIGPVALLAWVAVAIGYFPLTLVYGDLADAYPLAGGLQVYAQRAFGPLAGLVSAFLYWFSGVTASAAFVIGFISYAQVFVPSLGDPTWAFLLAQAILWTFTLVNVAGVKAGGCVSVAATVLKIVPLLVLAVALIPAAHLENLQPFAPQGFGSLLPAVGIIAWLFVGAESVTVPAEEVRDAGPTIRRAARAGYALAAGVYLLVAAALAVGVAPAAIAGSPSPLAVAARGAMGPWGETLLTAGALVSMAGILNGYMLVVGRLPYAAARDGLAPAWLARVHPRFGTPARAIAVSAIPTSLLMLLFFNKTLLDAYQFVALVSTVCALVSIGVACLAQPVLMRREPERFAPAALRRGRVSAAAGLAVAVVMIAGAGCEAIGWTAAVALVPVPYYLARRHRVPRESSRDEH